MISKKNKALAAGILAAAMSATSVLPSFASAATEQSKETARDYAEWFSSLYDDVITNGQENGYLSKNTNGSGSFGIPYHAVETLVVEAPDYGHETTSEAMSYIVWLASMREVLGQNSDKVEAKSGEIAKAWKTLEAMIPGWSKASSATVNYSSIWKQDRLKADTAYELDTPQEYPTQNTGTDAVNPFYKKFASAYSSDPGYYLMHWLADVDDWYGYGGGSGKFTFINTFQRGEQESCFETVPHPCIEELKYGNSDGIKGIFNGPNVAAQYAFTNAPDAEDRAIQAVYFANRWGVNTGEVSALAGKMGDQCRNNMFDKYYKVIGCQDINQESTSESNTLKSQHYLMSWYTSWGGALDGTWAWQIGCSHSHEFYQNPLAAYGLLYDSKINAGMKAEGATKDYEESLKRQIEMYLWLQSANGPIAGGCTNSYRGRYEKYPAGASTFYDMIYVEHPVYADPGSNHWIGNQVWAVQRLAELYYEVKTNGDSSNMKFGGLSLEEALDTILSRWVGWFIENTQFDVDIEGKHMDYAIPASLDWSGQPASWDASTTYSPSANSGLTCEITAYGQSDVGCVSSLCNTLIYYAAANKVDASAASKEDTSSTAAQGLYLANKLLSAQWDNARDDIGISYTETNGSLKRVFEQKVYIPSTYSGTMPDGSKLLPCNDKNDESSWPNTFSSIRTNYEKDPMYQDLKAYYDANGNTDGWEFKLHRFWHAGDAVMSYGTMALLYPDVKPMGAEEDTSEDLKVTLWGDADVDGKVGISDVVKVMMYVANKEANPITPQGLINADVYENGDGVFVSDALSIQKKIAQIIDELPESYKS